MSIFECNSNTTRQEFIQGYIDANKGSHIETGLISDGYHTFDELYFHRMILFSVLCKIYKNNSWKSRKHSNGEYPFGDKDWFIVGITTSEGDYTYHYHMEFWGHFEGVKELEFGKKWDGHLPKDITRLVSLVEDNNGTTN